MKIELLSFSFLPLAAGFTSHRFSIATKTSPVILSLIDEASVAASVSVDQVPQNAMKPTNESPAPAPVTGATLSADALSADSSAPSPAPEPAAAVPKPSKSVGVSKAPSTTPAVSTSSSGIDLDVPVIAGGLLALFAAGTFAMRQRGDEDEGGSATGATTPTAAAMADDGDVSIPYDAAARMAYDEWRSEHNKGGFDSSKYAKFKAKYEAIISANMAAKKKARDTNSEPKLQTLPASADS